MELYLWSLASILALTLMAVPSCIKTDSKTDREVEVGEDSSPASKLVDEAQLVDIPLPLYAQPQALPSDGDTRAFKFSTSLAREPLIELYRTDMERFGWRERGSMTTIPEVVLLYEKPYTWCTISIRLRAQAGKPDEHEVVLFISPKNQL